MIVYQAFNKHQINIDDTDEEDVLVHFLPAIAFIQAELDNDRGVLVHCQAGMSTSCIAIYTNLPRVYSFVGMFKGRSATIVAAYLMYSRQTNCDAALELIRKARPSIQ
jgi:dual specificity phosphatase 12